MKEYHIRPWELQELTLIECSVMMMALNDEDPEKLELKSHQDPALQAFILRQISDRMRKQAEYNNLSPQAKLDLAYEQYG